MPRPARRPLLPLLLAATALACSDAPAPTAPPAAPPATGAPPPPPAPTPPPTAPPASGGAHAYVVRGTATDTEGRPVAGAEVVVDNALLSNSAVTGTTGGDGGYRLTVPDGSWRVYARVDVTYHGRRYRFDLHPSDHDSFAGRDGAVRDFRWRLTGPTPPTSGRPHHGGAVDILQDPNSDHLHKENVELTFTPEGPLVDGSAGGVITRRGGPPRSETFSKIVDVPIGRYRVTARYAPPGGAPRPLAVRVEARDPKPYAASVVADFEPELTSCRNCMRVEVNWP
jgi:hypothetical protein